jgi:serine/threonine protein kinase
LDLIGKSTADGWQVVEKVEFDDDHTGGHFSSCFYVEKAGKRAFLKALDIEKFEISILGALLAQFEYETTLVQLCRDKRLRRIVQVLDAGTLEREHPVVVLRRVPYLVFEIADEGDIRSSVDISNPVSDRWRFSILHQTALALMQLHREAIAHQDLKPSNVLVFAGEMLKLGDLGRSSRRGLPAPHDSFAVAGARKYAPFEQRYSFQVSDWIERRLTTDVFHLGCLAVYVFTNVVFPEYVMERLPDPYKPEAWVGSSYADVLPHIQTAFYASVDEVSRGFPERSRNELRQMIVDLCNPDPARRGRVALPANASPDLLWLQRFASRFDALEKASRLRTKTNAQ